MLNRFLVVIFSACWMASCAARPASAAAVPPPTQASSTVAAETAGSRRAPELRAQGHPGSITDGSVTAPRTSGGTSAIPVVVADFAAQRNSVAEASTTGSHPERLSMLVPPTPFRLAAYQADPAAYLRVIEPGRAVTPAEPGSEQGDLALLSSEEPLIDIGGSCVLSVRAVPRAPVTFASLDMGAFDNGITTISVQADDAGIARVTYTATPGTLYATRIHVASPMCAGTPRFTVRIRDPESKP